MYIKEMKIERKGSGEKTSAYVYILPDFIFNGRKLPHPCPHASPCLVRLYARLKLSVVVLPARILLPSVLDPNHNAIFNPNRLVTVT
jgi:hypothetical protein